MKAYSKIMKAYSKICFVCKNDVNDSNSRLNLEVNLPVCNSCEGTDKEKETVEEYLEGLADDLVCGCI